MSIRIKVTPDIMREKAREVRQLKADHDQTMARLNSLIMNMNEEFAGKAHNSFVEQYQGMQGTFSKFSGMLEAYAAYLDQVAIKFEDQDS